MSTPKVGANRNNFHCEHNLKKPRKSRLVKEGTLNISIFHNNFHRILEAILATRVLTSAKHLRFSESQLRALRFCLCSLLLLFFISIVFLRVASVSPVSPWLYLVLAASIPIRRFDNKSMHPWGGLIIVNQESA